MTRRREPRSRLPFVRGLTFDDLPADVVAQAQRCLLDLIGVAASGRQTDAVAHRARFRRRARWAPATGGARLLFDGRRASAGRRRVRGRRDDRRVRRARRPRADQGPRRRRRAAGAARLRGRRKPCDGREFLTCLVLGYEIATRAGIALHATVPDYHCSGRLECARLRGDRRAHARASTRSATRHALGIAEYHGPRSQIMRCIDHPTMVKDGSGWGAHAGRLGGAASRPTASPARRRC